MVLWVIDSALYAELYLVTSLTCTDNAESSQPYELEGPVLWCCVELNDVAATTPLKNVARRFGVSHIPATCAWLYIHYR